ncbi:hypothetical protein [Streptomyces sp. NPDC020298]|uniref:hypothetical protein n=1 Tax=unclassified Streptomyces TaxID=2593676 RepID=UPI0033D5E117
MRTRRLVGLVCGLCALPLALLTGCQDAPGPAADGTPAGAATPTPSTGYGAEFLGVGECSSFGTTSFTEVPCAGERAAARVVARYDGTAADGPLCPPTTDFVLHISAQKGRIPQGYACMRDLEAPHPGDPGGGGGPRTVPGDCVYGSGGGQVRETACDGSGGRKPQYKVTEAVETRGQCPPSTDLYVQLGGGKPVGCARRV